MTAALPARFESKVVRTDTCWLWTGATNSRGYGCWGVNGVSQLAHRVAYAVLVGPIPAGLTIDHLCRVKTCVNPDHLEAVTLRENIIRAHVAAGQTHCINGHEYTPGNTYMKPRDQGATSRICRKCNYEACKRLRAKAKASAA